MSNKPMSGTRRRIPDWEIDEDFDLDLPQNVFEKIRRRDTRPVKQKRPRNDREPESQ
jgi:hypothetical protein